MVEDHGGIADHYQQVATNEKSLSSGKSFLTHFYWTGTRGFATWQAEGKRLWVTWKIIIFPECEGMSIRHEFPGTGGICNKSLDSVRS